MKIIAAVFIDEIGKKLDMNLLRFNRFFLLYFFGVTLCLSLFSSDAHAATFSFTEFNIAFVLGLMCPLLLIVALTKPVKNIRLRYLILLSSSVLMMLYALVYLTKYQNVLLLSAAMAFSVTLYFWLRKTTYPLSSKLNYLINFMVISAAAVFVFCLWFITQIDGYTAWLIASAVIITCGVLNELLSKKHPVHSSFRLSIQWLIQLAFVLTLYAWLNAFININWLVFVIVAGYLAALVNGCWYLVQALDIAIDGKSTKDIQPDGNTLFRLDSATNLPSYPQALSQFEQTIKRQGKNRFAVIVFQPINFQEVNKVLGHHNSDILLLQFAYCLQQQVENKDHLVNFNNEEQPIRIARLQGLHFLIGLDLNANNHPSESVIAHLCGELMAAVPRAMSFKSFSLNFELAFGAAFVGEHSHSISEVISSAEDALLVSVQNQQMLNYFDHENALYAEQQLNRMERLKCTILDEKLHWYIQPQICLAQKEVIGFQVKVHWYNNDSKIPEELEQFIETAKHSGFLYLFTKQMITEAFKVLQKLKADDFEKPVTISILDKELLEPALVDYIQLQAAKYCVSAKYLTVELNESVISSSSQKAKAIIDQLKSLNVGIAIGDFSGSYETLRYLRKVSVNQVKINCSLLSQNEEDAPDKAIINALINLTRTMNIPLIGTSIDNANTEQIFNALGGEFAQGRYLSRGVVFDEIEIWIKRWLDQYPQREQ